MVAFLDGAIADLRTAAGKPQFSISLVGLVGAGRAVRAAVAAPDPQGSD